MSKALFETKAIKDALRSNPKTDALAPIHADALYPLPVFERLSGLGKASMRKMRQKGLRVMRIGRCSYVRGSDVLEYYDDHAVIVA